MEVAYKSLFIIMIFFLCATQSPSNGHGETPRQDQRDRMVDEQIKARGVKDERVLKAMRSVPRHEFVSWYHQNQAYQDHPLSIGGGQTISQPYIVALMSELLRIPEGGKILEIGTGSGYQAAVLAVCAKEVYSIEIVPQLAESAERTLERLGYSNVEVRVGDGYLGWPEHAPFDGIIVTASPESIPEPLINQLKEGGRMVIPVGKHPRQTLYLVHKKDGKILKEEIIPVSFVPMVGMAEKEG